MSLETRWRAESSRFGEYRRPAVWATYAMKRGYRDVHLANLYLPHAPYVTSHRRSHVGVDGRRHLQRHHALLGIDANAMMSRLRIRGQRHLDARRQRAVGYELPSGLAWRELRAPEQIGEQADGGPLGEHAHVDHDVVERGIMEVHVVQVPHAPCLLPIASAHHLRGRAGTDPLTAPG